MKPLVSEASGLLHLGITYGLRLLYALIILLVGWWLAKRISSLVLLVLNKRKVDITVGKFVSGLMYYLLLIVVIMAVLNQLEVQTASMVAVLGGMSLAIGLSLRSSLSNLASGLLLIMFRPFKVGDYIQLSSIAGTVEEIKILYTQLQTSSRQQVTVPNNEFMNNAVTNFSANSLRRADIIIGIGYEDDIAKAKGILQDMIHGDSRILSDPEPLVVVKELADSSVNLLARFYTLTSDYWSVVFSYNETAKNRFDEAGISIPFPQSDVHLYQAQQTS